MVFCQVFVLAMAFFGRSENAPDAVAAKSSVVTNVVEKKVVQPSVDTNRLVTAAVKKALAEAAQAAAEDAKREAQAEKRRLEAREDAEKRRLEAREDEKAARAEQKAAEEEAKAERMRVDTRIFRVCHISAEEIAEKLNEIWKGDFGDNWKLSKIAVAIPESNVIMVTAPRPILEACEKAIAAFDVETQQVYIEARFVELGNAAAHRVGIDWSMLEGMTGSANFGGGIQTTRVGDGVTEYTRELVGKGETTTYKVGGGRSSDGSVAYFNGTLNFSQMALTLRALEEAGDSRTFSNPKIIVSSGKAAKVDMTTKYPNVKISAKRTESSGSQSLDIASNMEAIPGEDKFMFAKEAFFSWGISLEVTPRIGTNGLINVSIVPTISSLESWVETGTSSEDGTVSAKYPVIKVQRLISEFNLASGTTAVIGGLSITNERQADSGIPWLRDWWWIGPRLFGSKQRVKEQKEIIVFVTVGLVDPRRVGVDAGLPKNAVLGRQYVKGQKLEPGDRPEKNMEGIESLDLRLLEEQARDPLRQQPPDEFRFGDYIPFTKDTNCKKETTGKK